LIKAANVDGEPGAIFQAISENLPSWLATPVIAPIIKDLQAAGKTSLRAIAAGLNEQGIPAARGGEWSSAQIMRLLERLDPFREEEAQAA
jgi:hypothetical protein